MSAGQLLVEDTPLKLKQRYSVGFTFICPNGDFEMIKEIATKHFENCNIFL